MVERAGVRNVRHATRGGSEKLKMPVRKLYLCEITCFMPIVVGGMLIIFCIKYNANEFCE